MNYESVPPPLSRIADGTAIVQRVGSLLGAATVASLACTLPASLRVAANLSAEGASLRAWAASWAALGAAALGPMALGVVVLRKARENMPPLGGPSVLRAFGAAVWLAALLVALSAFGAVLRARTHQRALAGVTFACGALLLAVVLGLVAARVVRLLGGAPERTRRAFVVTLGALAVVAVGVLGARFVGSVLQDDASAAAAGAVVDVLLFTSCAVAASATWSLSRRPLAVVGPPLAVFVLALGITTLRDPPVRQSVADHAQTFAGVGSVVSGQ